MTIDLPPEALARLRAEADRRGVSLDALITEIAADLPSEDALEEFIGSGASGRAEPFDLRRERTALADETPTESL